MLSTIRSLLKDESGATAIEYALLVAGVGITLYAAFSGVTGSIGGVLNAVKGKLDTAAGSGTGTGTGTGTGGTTTPP